MVRPFGICVPTDSLLSFPVGPAVLDLSKATKLQEINFRLTSIYVGWIATVIQTTIPRHQELRKISVRVPHYLTSDVDTLKESEIYRQWLDLDRSLVQSWESHSTPPRVICTTRKGYAYNMRGFTECLLPEMTRRGIVDLC